MKRTVLPGGTIGVLGSGQLGRMFAIAARRLGYRVHVLSPDDDTPTGQVADVEFQASYGDLDAVGQFARQVDVVTFEFENVPAETIETVDKFVPVFPGGHVLHTTQHRLREKTFLAQAGIPVTPFLAIHSAAELEAAGDEFFPGVLKTAAWGYDGKGQAKVASRTEALSAWAQSNREQAILEKYVDFAAELSIVAVRGQDGAMTSYGPIANRHANHILDLSVAPGNFPSQVAADAIEIARTILVALDIAGVLCVEFFLTNDGSLLVNELAPRPHNSGHLTVDAHVACQFEQQARAVCGLPLACPTQLRPAAMVNLLGEIWQNGTPDWLGMLAMPDVKLHLYGKKNPLPGRKMGHLTVLADTPESAAERVQAARQRLRRGRWTNPEATGFGLAPAGL
ncbi:MAG: 5-(carboxyamino)imidazole ribonucleotide synthase [Pirellulaceae bacterium]|nr:5-(carboxyamino)imidazole ribonucleotide synthase [Pirellulaceae bacterium]